MLAGLLEFLSVQLGVQAERLSLAADVELGQAGLLHKDALTVNGASMWDNVKEADCWNREVIHPLASRWKCRTRPPGTPPTDWRPSLPP